MTELDVKLVKVDNWGIFFLQRLKHFFNRTDYCDLTLQFQDNAQLKVHRLVLSACTEYFELLERTCEMYEDCLVMPDDLQADVVVPIVNFMYTGQLEFRMDLLERLYQTSQIMKMPVLTKLLDAHRNQPALNYNNSKRSYSKPKEQSSRTKHSPVVAASCSKRPYVKAFGNPTKPQKEIKKPLILHKSDIVNTDTNNVVATPYLSPNLNQTNTVLRKGAIRDPRPTRYELPEELDTDNVFDNSFTNISYTSQPLMVHPETTKQYQRKKSNLFGETSSIRNMGGGTSTLDIVECKRVPKKETIFDEHDNSEMNDDLEMFSIKEQTDPNISNQLFDQIIDQPAVATGPKVTIETKDSNQANNIDHAKIISEVLKKYPHLVKSNKNIKLKILNTPSTPALSANRAKPPKKKRNSPTPYPTEKEIKMKSETPDCTYETDVLDSKEAARLIALGAENVKGPWICLICGTPGKALHFTSYYKFRRHLVLVHNEKPVSNMCEYCGLKSLKRNYLLHHLLTKHGVEPPSQYHFPKCNVCNYVALTEGLLVKHKFSHSDNRNFRCNVCFANYNTSNSLLQHIQSTGHKYCADRKTNLQCVYCLKVFLREGNLYAHLKTYHKQNAKADGIVDDSDEECLKEDESMTVKYEPQSYDTDYDDIETQYQILPGPDGNIELVTKQVNKQRPAATVVTPIKQKILNSGLELPVTKPAHPAKPPRNKSIVPIQTEENSEEIVMIDNNEYIMRNNQLILKKKKNSNRYDISDIPSETNETITPSTSLDYSNIQDQFEEENLQEQKMMIKKTADINQPIQIVVSNEEEYKALMNSNHSIIFDDGDTNKTLTVLSAPHNTAINTLELNSGQTSDMMIIQDNYPISVSEALPGDNSNIVVVYSHAVDEHNKQFQLITSQDIGAQFVQSSAVITQNFTTPTTVTPVMEGTQVMDSQIAESWPNNVQVDQRDSELSDLPDIQMSDQAEIIPLEQSEIATVEQTVVPSVEDTEIASATDTVTTSVEHTEVTATTSIHHTELTNVELGIESTNNEEPDITLTPDRMETGTEGTVQQNEIIDALQHPNEITTENVSNVPEASENENVEMTEEANNIVLEPMEEVGITTETVSDDNTNIEKTVTISTSNEPDSSEPNIESENNILSLKAADITQHTESHSIEENVTEEESNTMTQERESTTEEPGDVDGEDTRNTQADTNVPATPTSEHKTALPAETKEQIQSLTSEWSEDEYDTEEPIEENAQKNGQENISETESQEMEESIENIQQEMEKQISEVSGDTEDSVNENTNLEQLGNTFPVVPPQAKISLILNDWDENESQEGNDSTNGTEDDSLPTEVADIVALKEDVAVLEKNESKKDDKIKSLVSDWDDDEDESKN